MKPSVLVAIATARGIEPECMVSVMALMNILASICEKTQLAFFRQPSCELARGAAAYALMSDPGCTHLLFVDDDLSFDPKDVVTMLAADKPIVAIPYLAKAPFGLGQVFALDMTDEQRKAEPIEGLMEAQGVPAGLLLIHRSAIARIAEAFPASDYVFQGARVCGVFDACVVDGERKNDDWAFCWRARQAGLQPHILVDAATVHFGRGQWPGNYAHVREKVAALTTGR